MVEKIKKEKRGKVLVTGSNGMLGWDLCDILAGDYEVTGLDALEPKGAGPKHKAFIKCDITEKAKAEDSIRGAGPDLVVHAAAFTDVDGCELNPDKAKRVNEDGTEHIAFSTARLKIPLIYISTDFVFDGNKKSAYTEKDAPNPLGVYGRTKLGGEKKLAGLSKYIVIRTSWLFGRKGKNFVTTILDKAEKGEDLRVVDDQAGSPTYTRDLAGALKLLIDKFLFYPTGEVREIFHISNSGVISWFQYAKAILELANIKARISPIKTSESGRPAKRPCFSALDNAKFEKMCGFKMREWQKALKEYLEGI